jgi:hypothetical protein
VWPELKREICVERELLERLLATHGELVATCRETPPDHIETSALSAMLHSFYTGIENLFKRVTVHLDHGLMHGDQWHSRLLDSMAEATPNRPALISESLREKLRGYLSFRHVFRHAYAFELRWSKMAPLVLECAETLQWLERELDAFTVAMDARSAALE